MRVYSRERFWLYFYCATAPTASESAKQICEMAALRVMEDLFYERPDMNNGARSAEL